MSAYNVIRILILDDSPNIVYTLRLIVEQSGCQSQGVYTHSSALLAARKFQPDIFLTSFNNVARYGCKTAIEILMLLPQCRVIVFSGPNALNNYSQRGDHFKAPWKSVELDELIVIISSHEAEK
jgi:DNA-binding NarL/FixJ family response regulator